jgi:hypothetical protein
LHDLADLTSTHQPRDLFEENLPLFGAGPASKVVEETDIARMGGASEAAQVRALIAEHNRLREAAAAALGERKPKALGVTRGRAQDVRMAIREHGFDLVVAAIRLRGRQWSEKHDAYVKFSRLPWTERGMNAAVAQVENERRGFVDTPRGHRRTNAGHGARERMLAAVDGDDR